MNQKTLILAIIDFVISFICVIGTLVCIHQGDQQAKELLQIKEQMYATYYGDDD